MKFARMRALTPVAALAVALGAVGCSKAKSALEEAAGAKLLEQADIDKIKTDVNWNDKDPMYANLDVTKGFQLLDAFQGDLGEKVDIPIGVDLPNQANDAAGNQKSMVLVKEVDLKVDDKTTYKRLQIISVARFDAASKAIKIDGDVVNAKMDPDQVVNKKNGNQTGTYLLIQGKGDKGFAFLTGVIKLQRDGQAATAAEVTKNAWVFTTSSPFATKTGAAGTYFLTMLQGSKGSVVAFKSNIQTVGSEAPQAAAPGTPVSASKDISYSGVLDQYKTAFDSKIGTLGDSSATTKADTYFAEANTKVTDFVNGWKIVTSDLLFIQPKQTPPAAPTPPPAPPKTDPPAPAKPAAPATVPPAAPADISRGIDAATPNYNVDLGCNGYNDTSSTVPNPSIDMVRDGAYYEAYDTHPGWRAHGDVQYSWDEADKIFALPAGADQTRYLDGTQQGYCVLTTSDAMYQQSVAASETNDDFMPTDGMTSEMWQKVKVPATAKSIQIRAAFFSTEFPKFVGSQYNDSFFVKFDESPDVLATGNLNDLAGLNNAAATDADKAAIAACKGLTYADNKGTKCGDWQFVADLTTGMHGNLWGIADSTNSPHNGDVTGCLDTDASAAGDTSKRCWSGMIPPRTICKDLNAGDIGQVRTLRFAVNNAGDTFFPSALAVDSVVFSTAACATAPRLDPDSRASAL